MSRARLLALVAVSVAGLPSSASAGAALGFSAESPAPVKPGGTVTIPVEVTAPAGAAVTHFVLRPYAAFGAERSPWSPDTAGWLLEGSAAPALDAPLGGPSLRVPSLEVVSVKHEGAGALVSLASPGVAYRRQGCVRDGIREWGAPGGARLKLPAGESARLLLTVRVPEGWTNPATLALEIADWKATVPADSDLSVLGGGATNSLLQIPVPRTVGRDAVSLSAIRGRPGVVRLSGYVAPARAGVKVEIVGRAAAKSSDTRGFNRLSTALQQSGASKLLAVATTDASGWWQKQVRVPSRMAIVARTAGGFNGSLPGASCPLTVKG